MGLLEQLGKLIRFTMRAGSDVESGISEAVKQKAIKSNLFGQGFENGQRATIGCSYKGRIWSYRTTTLLELTKWCRAVGEKLTNKGLDPEEVLRGTLVPKFVAERPKKVPIGVEFWHCKFAVADAPGARIKELYEVCGQAQKSIRWLEKPRDLFTHLLRRDPRHYRQREETRYEVGSGRDLLRIREKADSQRVGLRVFVVQPGLSRCGATKEQLELLAVTENYLLETFAVPFGVVASN